MQFLTRLTQRCFWRLTRRPKRLPLPWFRLGLFLICSVGLLACGPASVPPTIEPVPSPNANLVEVPAPIESVSIALDYGDASLLVVTGLPNSCHSFGRYIIARDGDTFQVEIFNVRLDGPLRICAEIYGMVPTRIPLEGGVATCQVYQVFVNQAQYRVQAIATNVRCGNAPVGDSSPTVLRYGEPVTVGNDGLYLTLVVVVADSRCPRDVTCIWTGQATVLIDADAGNGPLLQVSLTLGDDPAQRAAVLDGHILELVKLEPYPVSTGKISQAKYVAHLTVTSRMP